MNTLGICARWFSEITSGGIFDLLVRLVVTFPRFAQIFFISMCSKFESLHKCSYFVSGNVLCCSSKWTFMKYFQMAESAFGQMGQWIGTFEQGDDEDDSAATA